MVLYNDLWEVRPGKIDIILALGRGKQEVQFSLRDKARLSNSREEEEAIRMKISN